MNGWNLGGTFPVDQLARFRALSEIDISNNPNMKADLKKMFDAFAQLQNLQVRNADWKPAGCVQTSDIEVELAALRGIRQGARQS